eukprot:741981_1
MSLNLQILQKSTILDDIIRPCRSSPDDLSLMILDETTLPIVDRSVLMSDLTPLGVAAPVPITRRRDPIKMSAIYFLSPCEKSAKLLVDDFEKNPKMKYTQVHLFFLGHIPASIMERIKSCRRLCSRLRCLREIFLKYEALQRRVFTIPFENSFQISFSDIESSQKAMVDVCADRLGHVLMNLKTAPEVWRLRNNVCEKLAASVKEVMLNHITNFKGFKWDDRPSKLLILDRSYDPLAPIMHDFHLESMIHDLLDVDGDIAKLPESDAVVRISERDEAWCKLRHCHIVELNVKLSEMKQEISSEEAEIKDLSKKDGGASLQRMSLAVRRLPEFKQLQTEFISLHNLSSACMTQFKEKDLLSLGEIEQSLATGVDDDGNKIKDSKFDDILLQSLENDGLSSVDAFRLLLVHTISNGGLPAERREEIVRAAQVDEAGERAMRGLNRLGVPIIAAPHGRRRANTATVKEACARARQSTVRLSRYEIDLEKIVKLLSSSAGLPANRFKGDGTLTMTLEMANAGKLPERKTSVESDGSRSPTFDPLQSTAKLFEKFRLSKHGEQKEEKAAPDQLLIIFVVGGITFAEICAIYRLSEDLNVEIIIGSTQTLTYKQYVDNLQSMESTNSDVGRGVAL